MSFPYVDALLQYDASKQSISKRFYVKALAAGGLNRRFVRSELFFSNDPALARHVEALKKALSYSQWYAEVFTMLRHYPTAAPALLLTSKTANDPSVSLGCALALRELVADIVKREPLVTHDPELDRLLGTVGIEELFDALMDLKMHSVLLKAADDQIKVMPHFAQWIYVTLLSRAAVRPFDGGPYSRVFARVKEWADDDQELRTTLLLAEIANTIASSGQDQALTRLITEYNRIPRTPMMEDEIRCYAMDLPELPTLLERHRSPLTMSMCLERMFAATTAHEQLQYADKGLSIAAEVNADAASSPFIDLLAGRARALFALGRHDDAYSDFEQLFMLQTADITEMYEAFIALLLARGPQEFDRALILIQQAHEIGNYYPALPWLELLVLLHRNAPLELINRTLDECMDQLPWIGLIIAGYHPMESSRDPGLPEEIDEQILSISLYIVQHAYINYPHILLRLRTLLR
ncbi:MAG: hypothetical protein NTX15_10965 [Candidatus Kapabacteria bacterium]|nr:hypothetical protein [Candidatus Kapabacteria bacterium]